MNSIYYHTYSMDDSGRIEHDIMWSLSTRDGQMDVTGEIIKLGGWSTPAMRKATYENGDETAWYIGTDADGNIVKTVLGINKRGETTSEKLVSPRSPKQSKPNNERK